MKKLLTPNTEFDGGTAPPFAPSGPTTTVLGTPDLAAQPLAPIPMQPSLGGICHTATPQPAANHPADTHQTAVAPAPYIAGSGPVFAPDTAWDGNADTLPTDPAGLLALRQNYFGPLPKFIPAAGMSPTEVQAELFRRRTLIAKAWTKLENPQPILEILRPVGEHLRHVGRAELRNEILLRVRAGLTTGLYDSLTIRSAANDPIIKFLIEDLDISYIPSLLLVLRKQVAIYAEAYFELWPQLYPAERIEEIQAELVAPGVDGDTASALHSELLTLASPASPIIANAARGKLLGIYRDIRSMGDFLLESAQIIVEKYKKDVAIEAERIFFAAFGLPRKETAVSVQYDKFLENISKRREHLKTRPDDLPGSFSVMPHPASTPLAWWGVDYLEGT